jgi:hypothetical protein
MDKQLLTALRGVHKLSVKAGWETGLNVKDDDDDNESTTVVSGSHKNADGNCSVLGYDAVSTGI